MEVEKQIEVLSEAYFMIQHEPVTGFCSVMNTLMYSRTNLGDYDSEMSWSIPTFTRKHVKELCEEHGLPEPQTLAGGYWWPMFDKEPRLQVLDLLIWELEEL